MLIIIIMNGVARSKNKIKSIIIKPPLLPSSLKPNNNPDIKPPICEI